jgi:hypothetical protein
MEHVEFIWKTNFEKAYLLKYLKSDNKVTDMTNIMNFPEQVQEKKKKKKKRNSAKVVSLWD